MSIATSRLFQDSWLEEEEFKSLLRKVKDDKIKYRCIVCNKKLSLSISGRCALTGHAGGNKHIKNVTKGNFFKPLSKHDKKCSSENQCIQQCSQQSSSSAQQPSTLTQQTLNSNIVAKSTTTAEIIWALKYVLSGYSNSSRDDIANTFKAMCRDSQIAKDFELGRLKLMYIVKYGIAPYFKQLRDVKLKKTPLHTLSFDKSLNEITQEFEMVVMVQYWDEEENEVRTRYLGSTFLGHSTAVDLMDKLNKIIKHLDPEKVYQIFMDGPAVNISS